MDRKLKKDIPESLAKDGLEEPISDVVAPLRKLVLVSNKIHIFGSEANQLISWFYKHSVATKDLILQKT